MRYSCLPFLLTLRIVPCTLDHIDKKSSVVYSPPPSPEIPVGFWNSRWIPVRFPLDSEILGGFQLESSLRTSIAMFLYLFA